MDEPETGLALTGGAVNAKTASDECSPALWARLTESGIDAKEAARRIAFGQNIGREVVAVAPKLAVWAAPMPRERLIARLAVLKSVYGAGDRSEGEWVAFFATYADALGQLPEVGIEAAILEWTQTGREFFPASSELFKLATKHAAPVVMAAYRARLAAEAVARGEKAKAPNDPEEAAKVKALLAEMTGADGKLTLKPRTIPTPARSGYDSPHEMAEAVRRKAEAGPKEEDEEPCG